jgi:hypothetical protein
MQLQRKWTEVDPLGLQTLQSKTARACGSRDQVRLPRAGVTASASRRLAEGARWGRARVLARDAKKKRTAAPDSRVVPHLSTNGPLSSLTLRSGRDAVLSRRYGRS